MPETKVHLDDKTDKKVRFYMASRNIKNKGEAIQHILMELSLDVDLPEEEEKNANL